MACVYVVFACYKGVCAGTAAATTTPSTSVIHTDFTASRASISTIAGAIPLFFCLAICLLRSCTSIYSMYLSCTSIYSMYLVHAFFCIHPIIHFHPLSFCVALLFASYLLSSSYSEMENTSTWDNITCYCNRQSIPTTRLCTTEANLKMIASYSHLDLLSNRSKNAAIWITISKTNNRSFIHWKWLLLRSHRRKMSMGSNSVAALALI